MNFLKVLQTRVKILQNAGREVIVVGDINIMRAPIDSGEGGIKTSAAQHYEHPARRILDDWCAPKGPMIDVVRESWPDREGMFTVWNQKLDARCVRKTRHPHPMTLTYAGHRITVHGSI